MRTSACCLLLAVATLPALAQQELLQNTSFEEVTDKGLPTGWSQYGGGVPESVLKVEATARTGKSAVRLTDTGPNERDNRYAIGVQQDVPVTPGRFYLASVWAKALARNNDQAVVLQISFLGGAEARNVSNYVAPPIGGDWKRYSLGGVAPDDAKTARVYVYTMHFWTSDTLIDDVSLKEAAATPSVATAIFQFGQEPLAGPRKLKLQTPLARGGEPAAVIACPSDPQWRQVAMALQTAIQRKTGATLPIHLVTVQGEVSGQRPDGDPAARDNRAKLSELLKTDQTILALGNLNNNFVTERLYFNGYTRADSLWPGAGAFALRTVHQPFNFGDINVLAVEASDLEGARAGALELAKRLPDSRDCALDQPLLFVSNTKPMGDEQRQKLLAGKPSASLLMEFHRACAAYRDSGDEGWALQAKRLMGLCRERLVTDPQYKLDWPEETSSNDIGKMWDVIEEAPVWSDTERAEAENVIFATMLGMRRNVYNWGTFANNDTIVWNHQTFPLLGVYWMARWLERWYPDRDVAGDYLAQVHGAFRGQLKSWKPQCDADGYLTITPRHTIEYTLSRNDYRFFESGNVRQFAEYLTGVCDNQGNIPGFGDSGYGKGPGYELNGLPLALWYYKDPRYLWRLQQIYGGKWQNPYHTDIKPQPWPEIVGVNVYRMPAEYYKWATTSSSYGEATEKTEVTYEQSFDKISFREDISRDGQFLLLDGFARGKHLQYDGNSIIRYHADGEDWLIDSDYLVRNTTDHNMISIVRDGRCAVLEPAFTSLDAHADLPGVGFTRTTVQGYNGADWTRNILWLKGEGFVVVDELTARQPGSYTFENVFKMLDLGKLEFDGRCVKVSRPTAGGMGSRDLSYTQAEGGSKVVRFGNQGSRLEFPVTLPAGEYAITLFGQGTGGGTDSFWLQVDEAEPVACHVPIEKLGPSSAAWTKDVPTPNVKIGQSGTHIVRITLREGPGTMLHKVTIADRAGREVATIDALKPPPLPQDLVKAAPDACFHLKGDGLAQAAITDRTNNVNLRLKYLRHLFGGKLQAGQTVTDQVLFYSDRSDQPRHLDLRRVGDHRVLILRAGKPWGLLDTGVKGAVATLQTLDNWVAFSMRGLTPGGKPIADHPYSLLIDYRTTEAHIHAMEPTVLDEDFSVPAGRSIVWKIGQRINTTQMRREAVAALDAAAKEAVAPKPAGAEKLTILAMKQVWASPPVMEDEKDVAVVNRLVGADLNGDAKPELLVGRGSKCVAFDLEGKALWTVETGGRVNDMCVADVNGDQKPEVLIASDDEFLYTADAAGKVLSKTHCDAQLRIGTSSVRDPRLAHVGVGDVDADGKLDIIVGTRNGNIVRYDLQMNKVWSFNQIEHGTFRMRLIDLDKDGKLEVVAGNRYGAVEVVDCKGRAMAGAYSELGDVVFDVADLNGDGQPDIVNGSSTGAFTCTPWRGRVAWNFDNFGYGAREVKCADVDGDGKIETALASETGYVYLLNADGSVKTMRQLSAPVLSLAVAGTRIVAGCRDGIVYELDAQLQPVKAAKLGGPVTQMTLLDTRVAVGAGEAVVALQW